MAIVWRALDRRLGREVAVKELREEIEVHPDGLARFRREAEAVARLSHTNVVAFFDMIEEGSRLFLVMELVRGSSLAQLLAKGSADVRSLVTLVEKVARGVQHAHEQGVLHRDLKPSNILVTDSLEPKVTDFGLAHLAGGLTLTRTGELLGTPAYMAPEQARGEATDARTDVYGLGAILYEALSGSPPFRADGMPALLRKVLKEEPAAPRASNAKVHVDLETVALRCLAKEPARRYASAGAVADELGRFLRGEPILARPPGLLERGGVWARRNRRGVVAGVLVLGALAASGSLGLARWGEARRRHETVERALAGAVDVSQPEDGHAVDRIVASADESSVAVIGSALDALTARLARATREEYLSAREPTADEARSGAERIEGLESALDHKLGGDERADVPGCSPGRSAGSRTAPSAGATRGSSRVSSGRAASSSAPRRRGSRRESDGSRGSPARPSAGSGAPPPCRASSATSRPSRTPARRPSRARPSRDWAAPRPRGR